MTQSPPPTAVAPLLLPSFAPSPSALPCLLGLPRFLSSLPPSSPAFVQRVRPVLNPSLEAVSGAPANSRTVASMSLGCWSWGCSLQTQGTRAAA